MSNSEEIHATFLPAVATQQAVLTAPLFSLLENTSQSTPEQQCQPLRLQSGNEKASIWCFTQGYENNKTYLSYLLTVLHNFITPHNILNFLHQTPVPPWNWGTKGWPGFTWHSRPICHHRMSICPLTSPYCIETTRWTELGFGMAALL